MIIISGRTHSPGQAPIVLLQAGFNNTQCQGISWFISFPFWGKTIHSLSVLHQQYRILSGKLSWKLSAALFLSLSMLMVVIDSKSSVEGCFLSTSMLRVVRNWKSLCIFEEFFNLFGIMASPLNLQWHVLICSLLSCSCRSSVQHWVGSSSLTNPAQLLCCTFAIHGGQVQVKCWWLVIVPRMM